MAPGDRESEPEVDQFLQLERGLAALTFSVFHAAGSPTQITGWSGSGEQLTGVEVGDHLWIDPVSNPPGINVHTSLGIDDISEEWIALAVIPIHPLKEDEAFDMDLPLDELRSRKADATRTHTATLDIGGRPEPWILVEGESAWAATRHHSNLTITVAGRGCKFVDTRLDRVSDPLALDRPERAQGNSCELVMETSEMEIPEAR